jgi:hypothetical protein
MDQHRELFELTVDAAVVGALPVHVKDCIVMNLVAAAEAVIEAASEMRDARAAAEGVS